MRSASPGFSKTVGNDSVDISIYGTSPRSKVQGPKSVHSPPLRWGTIGHDAGLRGEGRGSGGSGKMGRGIPPGARVGKGWKLEGVEEFES